MPTPNNAPYKKQQREAKLSERRHYVIWTSCATEGAEVQGMMIKRKVQGTKRIDRGLRGKAATKAAKRSGHIKGGYLHERTLPF